MGKKWQKNALAGLMSDRKAFWFMRLLRVAASSIVWEGLPSYIPTDLLEWNLTVGGRAIIIYDDMMDKYFMGGDASMGDLSIYGTPTMRAASFENGTIVRSDVANSVVIRNNVQSTPDLWLFETLAEQLADLDLAIKINCNSQKTMPILPASIQQKMTIENAYKMREQNIPYLIIDPKSMDINAFKDALTFDNRRSFTSDQMMYVQRELWGRCLTMLGVNNDNIDKKERVNTFEVNANLDEIAVMRNSRLAARKYACDLMHDKWGFDINVKYVADLNKSARAADTGGDDNGVVYYNSEDNM